MSARVENIPESFEKAYNFPSNPMKWRVFLAIFLVHAPLLADDIELKKVDPAETTVRILELSVITLLPLLGLFSINQRPGFPTETVITVSLLGIPALIGWPLFFHELGQAKKKGIALP